MPRSCCFLSSENWFLTSLAPYAVHPCADIGPEGFTTETLEIDIREGGRWRFIYTGSDGTRWENRMVLLRVEFGYQTLDKLARHLGVG